MEFKEFPKIPRLFREIVITEKIDGTNAQVVVPDDETAPLLAGSRTRFIDCERDNYGFARWVRDNQSDLRRLGPGVHFGEWWGQGINRGYGIKGKRFSLFNVSKWADANVRPECCDVVPVLYRGPLSVVAIKLAMQNLEKCGSVASPGFMRPEGIVVYHSAGNVLFKATLENDEKPKALCNRGQ